MRAELERVVAASGNWDGDLVRLHVTDTGERSIEVRALMSAADSPRAFELRCEVREALIGWLQREHPESLPVLRLEERPVAPGSGSSDDTPPPDPSA
jgi:hypothetical protein